MAVDQPAEDLVEEQCDRAAVHRTVAAEEAEDTPFRHGEAELIHSREITEAFHYAINNQRCHRPSLDQGYHVHLLGPQASRIGHPYRREIPRQGQTQSLRQKRAKQACGWNRGVTSPLPLHDFRTPAH